MHWIGRAHILPTWQSNFTSYEERGWCGPCMRKAWGYAVCMYHSACISVDCRHVAEAQVYLMQECHASVACNLHVHLYIWRLMRDHPQPVRRRVAKGRAFFIVYLSNHLAYVLALFEDHLRKDHKQSSARLCNPVPDWVLAPFFPSCLPSNSRSFPFSVPFAALPSLSFQKSPPHPSPQNNAQREACNLVQCILN